MWLFKKQLIHCQHCLRDGCIHRLCSTVKPACTKYDPKIPYSIMVSREFLWNLVNDGVCCYQPDRNNIWMPYAHAGSETWIQLRIRTNQPPVSVSGSYIKTASLPRIHRQKLESFLNPKLPSRYELVFLLKQGAERLNAVWSWFKKNILKLNKRTTTITTQRY